MAKALLKASSPTNSLHRQQRDKFSTRDFLKSQQLHGATRPPRSAPTPVPPGLLSPTPVPAPTFPPPPPLIFCPASPTHPLSALFFSFIDAFSFLPFFFFCWFAISSYLPSCLFFFLFFFPLFPLFSLSPHPQGSEDKAFSLTVHWLCLHSKKCVA